MSKQTDLGSASERSSSFTLTINVVPYLPYVGGPYSYEVGRGRRVTIKDGEPLPSWARHVLMTVLCICQWGEFSWKGSNAQLSDLTGLSARTCSRAMELLRRSGYVRRFTSAGGKEWKTVIEADVVRARGVHAREVSRLAAKKVEDEQEFIGLPSHSVHPSHSGVGASHSGEAHGQCGEGLSHCGESEASYLYDRSSSLSLATPPPSGAREGEGHQEEGEPGPTLSRRQVADFWNGHPRRPTGAARISDRMPYPDLILEVSPELARAAIEAYFDHAGQATPEWSPLPNLGWKKFREVVGPIVQWLLDPSLPEPGMGRGFSEARRSGRQPRQRPRLQLVTEAPQAPPAIECGWDGWEEAKAEIRTMMPRAEFDIWVTPCVPQAPPTNGRLRLVVPNGYFRDWLREKHMAALVDGVAEVAGEVSIDIITLEEAHG